jgi:hypothetical protein
MNEIDPRIEGADGGLLETLAGALVIAIQAAIMALVALILALLTLLARALQAVFVLARPASLVGCVAAAGYTSVTLFATVLAHYGGDAQAIILALAAIIIAPTALLVLDGDYGAWAIMLAVAGVELLAMLLLERAPTVVKALLPVLALTGTVMFFLQSDPSRASGSNDKVDEAEHLPEKEQPNVEQEWNERTVMDCDDLTHHLHSDQIV